MMLSNNMLSVTLFLKTLHTHKNIKILVPTTNKILSIKTCIVYANELFQFIHCTY
jgi:hypothetical protein